MWGAEKTERGEAGKGRGAYFKGVGVVVGSGGIKGYKRWESGEGRVRDMRRPGVLMKKISVKMVCVKNKKYFMGVLVKLVGYAIIEIERRSYPPSGCIGWQVGSYFWG